MEKLWNSSYLRIWTANFFLFFAFMLIVPLLPVYLRDTFGADKNLTGIVLCGYSVTALIMRLFSGYIVDRFPRKIVLVICFSLVTVFFFGYMAAGTLLFFAAVRTLHGAPFGAATVSSSTVAVDVLPENRRAEGIGYYGLSNNIATAVSPALGLYIYETTGSFSFLFVICLISAGAGLLICLTMKHLNNPEQQAGMKKQKLSLSSFFLVNGWFCSIPIICFAFSYGLTSTYVAIYGHEELNMTGGAGFFFSLFAVGLMLSRLIGTRTLRQGRIKQNASLGITVSACGYLLFASVHTPWAYYLSALIIGLGNGHMYPAFQNMFINLADDSQRGTANSSLLSSWDIGAGLGILAGGSVAEYFGYHSAFWTAWAVNISGALFFLLYAGKKYMLNRLR